ncbi:transposase [Peptococcaceae bacterium 1198_IL3148]
MARQARKRSSTGVYHVMLRGINKSNIFWDNEDKGTFVDKLLKFREIANFKLYGYCLMDNHVHLLIAEGEDIGTSIKRISVSYANWHNTKYARVGHLYQNRFLSEPVETESYLVNVLRYIHQNPVKAKMVKRAADYFWSSYHQYITAYQHGQCCIDFQLVKGYFTSQRAFEEYMNAENYDQHLDVKPVTKYSDAMLQQKLQRELATLQLEKIPTTQRNEIIKLIYQRTGVSIRQLARVLGLGKNIVEKAVK